MKSLEFLRLGDFFYALAFLNCASEPIQWPHKHACVRDCSMYANGKSCNKNKVWFVARNENHKWNFRACGVCMTCLQN
jgi:hypothetical protein